MASTEVTAITHTCDNPKCDTSHTLPVRELPDGYHFEVFRLADGKQATPHVDAYACKATCVRPAVVALTAIEPPQETPAAVGDGDDD